MHTQKWLRTRQRYFGWQFAVIVFTAATLVATLSTAHSAAAAVMSNGWTAPLSSMASPAAGFLANACDHTGYGSYDSGFHIGADFWGKREANGTRLGNDPVYSLGSGVVTKVTDFGAGNGYVVMIEHVAADDAHFVAVYGHLNDVGRPALTKADGSPMTVAAGQQIGTLDPNAPQGAHLHLGIHPNANGALPIIGWGTMPCPIPDVWPPTDTHGFVDPMGYLDAHNAVNQGDLVFVNKNSYTGHVELGTYAQPGYQTGSWTQTGMSAYTDPNTIPVFKFNGDLVFVNKNSWTGHVEIGTYTKSSNYTSGSWTQTGMSSYTDPNTIPMFKPNGDLAFVNKNSWTGHVEIGTYTQGSNYASGTWTQTGMSSYADPNTVPMFKFNGDLVFVNKNSWTGHVEIGTYAQPSYQTGSWTQTGMNSYTDPYTIPMLKPNGDLAFVNKNSYTGHVEIGTYPQPGYQTGTWTQTGMNSYTDPYTVPAFR